jgi:hypothetical protein
VLSNGSPFTVGIEAVLYYDSDGIRRRGFNKYGQGQRTHLQSRR